MTNTQKEIKKAIAKSAEGYPLLGYALYWSIPAMRVRYVDLLKLMQKHGIDSKIAKNPRAKSALNRAVRDTAKNGKGTFHRKALDNAEQASFVIVNTAVDQTNSDVDFNTETKIMFDKETNAVAIEGASREEIKSLYEEYKEQYTQEQIRTVVLRYLYGKCEATSVRDQGGVYFVPSTHTEDFQRIKACVEELPGVSIDVIPIIDTPEAKRSLWKSFVGDVETEMAALARDLEETSDEKMSDRSFQLRLNRFKTLQDKIGTYEDLLTGTAVDLKTKLETLTQKLRVAAGA